MKSFCFTVDDNIRFFKEIAENNYKSIFEHPYLNLYRRLHEKFNLKIQLNLFYRMGDFNLSLFSEKYSDEFKENAHWLKLSFHSDSEKSNIYMTSPYEEVFDDLKKVNDEILRFASKKNLAKTTTIHCCRTTPEGLTAIKDNGVKGLLGLWDNEKNPRVSYNLDCDGIYKGEIKEENGISFSKIDIILNSFKREEILAQLEKLKSRDFIKTMIHEQYFYADYKNYQPDFEDKIASAFDFLIKSGYESVFFEDMI